MIWGNLLFVGLLVAHCVCTETTIVVTRDEAPGAWRVVSRAKPSDVIEFTVQLKQDNLEKLDEIFWGVSDPDSPTYGKFLSTKEVNELVAPPKAVQDAFLKWLAVPGVKAVSHSDHIKVTAIVEAAEKLLQTTFHKFVHAPTGKKVTRFLGTVSVPSHLVEHLDFIAGISEFFVQKPRGHFSSKTTKDAAPQDDIVITPPILKSYYNVPAGSQASNPNNLQSIAAFNDYFSMGALKQFAAEQNYTYNLQRVGIDCIGDNPPCDQYESDLDVQYVTSMGLHVPTVFRNIGANYWILEWIQEVNQMTNPPLVNSISYGWSELEQCNLTAKCQQLGYTSQQYVSRTNTEFKKLGTAGVTVLVSSGDDGSPSLGGATGNCPLDYNEYCPLHSCPHSDTKCNEFIITSTSSNAVCVFPMGIESDGCSNFLSDPNLNNALNDWINQNTNCNLNIEMDRDQLPHVYSTCSCSNLQWLNNDYGYSIQQYVYNRNNGALFVADYPTSSPYVTSVGATQFISQGGKIQKEVGASILYGAKITTGGGFSSYQTQPSYQASVVSQYFKNAQNLPPAYSYNTQMRAYPDISFNGHNYLIAVSNNSDTCNPCQEINVDGTSCSSPAFAGLLSLINDELLNNNLSPIGFFNPTLYKMVAAQPNTVHDIVEGDTRCTRAYCCKYGYFAAEGWDPVSGLGSPNFANMKNFIVQAKLKAAGRL